MELNELDELYRDVILDHYRSPRHHLRLESPDVEAKGFNPFCGDEINLQLKLDDGRVAQAGFQGKGCSISQASGSMLAEVLEGKTLEETKALSSLFRRMMHGQKLSPEELERLGDLEVLAGVRKFPIRIKCALLAWATLDDGIERYRGGKK